MRLIEIETRLATIKTEVETDGADLDALETELKSLKEERQAIMDKVEKRKALLDDVASMPKVEVIKDFKEERKVEELKGIDSPEYRSAFLKSLQGKPLTEIEQREYVMTPPALGGSGASAVPQQTANMIFDNMVKIAPMLNEIMLMRVAGNLRFAVQGVRNAAAVHIENAPVASANDTLIQVTLTGYEFMKVVSVSATVRTMSIDAFESWLAKILGEDIAQVIDNEIINGGSVSGNIAAAQVWVNGVNQITYVPANGLAYPDITNLIALLPSAFDGNAKFVMNKATFYRQVLGMTDVNGNPIAVPDIASPGRYTILGYPVLIDDNVVANEAFLGDFKQVVGNLSQDITVESSAQSGFLRNSIDYRGTAIFDCDIAQPTAIVKLNA